MLIVYLVITNVISVNATNNRVKWLEEKDVGEEKAVDQAILLEDIEVQTDIKIGQTRVDEYFESSEQLEKVAETSYIQGVEIDENIYDLYPEFKNPEEALEKIKKKCSNAIQYLDNKYNLQGLSNETIEKYQGCTLTETEALEIEDKNIISEMILLDEFFNMYENTEMNREIIEIVKSIGGKFDNTSLLDTAGAISELYILVPFNTGITEALDKTTEIIEKDIEKRYNITTEELQQMYQDKLDNQRKKATNTNEVACQSNCMELVAYGGNSKFSVSKGIEYAGKYSNKGNSKQYRIFDKDCTNFASQIKKYGGVKQYYVYEGGGNNVRINSNKSWYYGGAYNYGKIWTTADKFAKFFGVKASTSSFYTFSTKVKKVSFIAYSKFGDGKWNHMGFVTAKSTGKKKTNGVTYYDFKVAQHTKNYHQWVSHKDNGWETLKSNYPKVKFSVVN